MVFVSNTAFPQNRAVPGRTITAHEKLRRVRPDSVGHTARFACTRHVPGTGQDRNKGKQVQAALKRTHKTGKGTGPRWHPSGCAQAFNEPWTCVPPRPDGYRVRHPGKKPDDHVLPPFLSHWDGSRANYHMSSKKKWTFKSSTWKRLRSESQTRRRQTGRRSRAPEGEAGTQRPSPPRGALTPETSPVPESPSRPQLLTESTSSFLLDSPMLFKATSTSFCPGRQFTQLFNECETALATCMEGEKLHKKVGFCIDICAHVLGRRGDSMQSWTKTGNYLLASSPHCLLPDHLLWASHCG